MKIISAVYSHPEFYPPTLNAANILADDKNEVILFFRNVKQTDASYNENITLIKSGEYKPIRETEVSSHFWKVKSFLLYTANLYRIIRKTTPQWVIVYDAIPLLAFSIIALFLRKTPKLWYHNHDVLEESRIKKYSVSWFALKNERKAFKKIDLFSLPSKEREVFFPLNQLKGKYFFLPNYPLFKKSLQKSVTKHNKTLKIIYQGHIGDGHGLIELINYIKQLNNDSILLSIIGYRDSDFVNILTEQINDLNLNELVKIYDPLPYHFLRDFTLQHDIGWAVHLPKNIQNATGSTSSNKIYEYISCSLPVILYNIETYTNKLKEHKWAFFTDLSYSSLQKSLSEISENYIELSSGARKDFENKLNFEVYFSMVVNYLK